MWNSLLSSDPTESNGTDLQCDGGSLGIDVHVPRQDAELDNEGLLHLDFTMRENPQLDAAGAFLSIPEEEGPVEGLPDVRIERKKSVSAVWAEDDPANLSGDNKQVAVALR